jgi:hypothetical protein
MYVYQGNTKLLRHHRDCRKRKEAPGPAVSMFLQTEGATTQNNYLKKVRNYENLTNKTKTTSELYLGLSSFDYNFLLRLGSVLWISSKSGVEYVQLQYDCYLGREIPVAVVRAREARALTPWVS